MKIFSDYIQKYSKNETIKLCSSFKKEIIERFKNDYNLIDVEPKLVYEMGFLNNDYRDLNFDNLNNKKIYSIATIDYFNLLEQFYNLSPSINSGVMCYHQVINRDYNPTPIDSSNESIIELCFKSYSSELNEKFLSNLSYQIITNINDLEIRKKYGRKINKNPKILSLSKLAKRYLTISNQEQIIYEETLKHDCILLFWDAKHPKKENQIINSECYATLYIFDNINNMVIEIFSIFTTTNKNIINNLSLNVTQEQQTFKERLLSFLPEITDAIYLKFNISKYLVFALDKFCINEVVACNNDFDIDDKLKNKYFI